MKSGKPQHTREDDDPSQQKDTTDTHFLDHWHVQLHDDGDRHHDDGEVGEDVDESGAEDEFLEIDTMTAGYGLVPGEVDGRALKDDGGCYRNAPTDDESSHGPDSDPKAQIWYKCAMIEDEHGRFDRYNSSNVDYLKTV